MSEPQPSLSPILLWLLQSGGAALLALGLILAVIGIVLVVRPNLVASTILAILSLIPGILGLLVIYSAAVEYREMAVMPTPPKPAEFAAVTGRAISYSFCGLLGTLLPIVVTVLAIVRGSRSLTSSRTEEKIGSED